MSDIWKNWCRLCAKEEGYKISIKGEEQGHEILLRISKYLSFQIQDDVLPNSICTDCCTILSEFDSYSSKCERVQSLFNSFVNDKQNQSSDSYRILRNDFLLHSNYEEKKFLLPVNLKRENKSNEPNDNNKESYNIRITRKRKKILEPKDDVDLETEERLIGVPVKNEKDSDNEDTFGMEDCFDFSIQSDSDEDYNIPLANVTENNKKIQKKKVKKLKTSTKNNKLKKKKVKKEHNVINSLEDVCIKVELTSDTENCNGDLNIDLDRDKKVRKEKKNNPLSFLKYDCYICGEDAKNWNALCIHFRDVHDARAKIMCCCGKFLASRVSIGRHSAKHGKTSNSFDCSKCNKRFPRESELRTHMISHLPKEEYPFVCCKCARRFTTQQLLRHHEKKHIPMEERLTHPCDICQSKFASKSSLMMHMKAVHERLKPFVCDQCGRAFTTKGILEEHQVRHSDARPHVCNICHKSFKTKQRLAIHSDTHDDTVYQCPHCPIKLNSRRTLRMHLFVHDEVCRYQCNFCEKAFKRAKDLKNHSNLHTGRRPYSCPWCSRTFANGSNCRAHKRRMHPNELRISDASAAMVNKVSVPETEESEEKQTTGNNPPKVIYTTVKRKLPTVPAVKTPNFVFQPDVSDKEFKADNNKETVQNKDVSNTKKEKKSPDHNTYESSMSPLNLNTSAATNKQAESALTITPVVQNDNAINDFQTVAENYNAILQSKVLEQAFNPADFKDNQDSVFSKNNQLYTNFGSNLYNIATSTAQFAATNPYTLHFARDEGH